MLPDGCDPVHVPMLVLFVLFVLFVLAVLVLAVVALLVLVDWPLLAEAVCAAHGSGPTRASSSSVATASIETRGAPSWRRWVTRREKVLAAQHPSEEHLVCNIAGASIHASVSLTKRGFFAASSPRASINVSINAAEREEGRSELAPEAVYFERRDDQRPNPDPARCSDCPVDPAPAAQ